MRSGPSPPDFYAGEKQLGLTHRLVKGLAQHPLDFCAEKNRGPDSPPGVRFCPAFAFPLFHQTQGMCFVLFAQFIFCLFCLNCRACAGSAERSEQRAAGERDLGECGSFTVPARTEVHRMYSRSAVERRRERLTCTVLYFVLQVVSLKVLSSRRHCCIIEVKFQSFAT